MIAHRWLVGVTVLFFAGLGCAPRLGCANKSKKNGPEKDENTEKNEKTEKGRMGEKTDWCPFVDRPLASHSGPRPLSSHAHGPGPGAALAVVDLDGDGSQDVIATRGFPHTAGSIEIHYGPVGHAAPVLRGEGKWHGGMAIGDVGGDDCLDLVVALEQSTMPGANTGGVDIYLGERRNKTCALAEEAISLAIPPRSGPESTFGARVALVHFDQGDKLDIAVTQLFENALTPTEQYVCMNTSSAIELGFDCQPLATKLGGALDVGVADFDGDGHDDLLFGGVRAEPEANPENPRAWGVIALGAREDRPELVLEHECAGECDVGDFPNLVDLEILASPTQGAPRVAAVFSHHECSGVDACRRRAVAKVVAVDVDPAAMDARVRELWSTAGACVGNFASITAARLSPTSASHDLVIGYHRGRGTPLPGHMLIAPTQGDTWGPPSTWSYLMGRQFYAHALIAADLPGHDDPPNSSPSTTAAPRSGMDILYIPAYEGQSHPIHILEYR